MSIGSDNPASPDPPPSMARLFPALSEAELIHPGHRAFVIGRLLEDGDTDDLRWLARTVGEDILGTWFAERGRRQLSRRSRAFWSLVLAGSPAPDTDDPLWPF